MRRRLPPFAELRGFLLAGAANTVLTLLVYEALLFVAHYLIAYFAAVLTGWVFAAVVNARFAFGTPLTSRRFVLYVLGCLLVMVLGLALLEVMISIAGISPVIAPFAVILIVLPVNFVLTRASLTSAMHGTRQGGACPPGGKP